MEHNREIFNVCGKGAVVLEEAARHFSIGIREHGEETHHYEASTEKLERFVKVPTTKETVFAFIEEKLKGGRYDWSFMRRA